MSAGAIVAIIVVVIVVIALIVFAAISARRRRLRQRFGPEYDRAVENSDSKRKAEAELAEREKRVKQLDIRPLDPATRQRYTGEWATIQQQFVDTPDQAVAGARSLITGAMRDRGYPTEDSGQIMADLSVEHAETLEHYRTAQDLSAHPGQGSASGTEDLRQAMVHYRALFRELVGDDTAGQPAARGAAASGTAPAGAGDFGSEAVASGDSGIESAARGGRHRLHSVGDASSGTAPEAGAPGEAYPGESAADDPSSGDSYARDSRSDDTYRDGSAGDRATGAYDAGAYDAGAYDPGADEDQAGTGRDTAGAPVTGETAGSGTNEDDAGETRPATASRLPWKR